MLATNKILHVHDVRLLMAPSSEYEYEYNSIIFKCLLKFNCNYKQITQINTNVEIFLLLLYSKFNKFSLSYNLLYKKLNTEMIFHFLHTWTTRLVVCQPSLSWGAIQLSEGLLRVGLLTNETIKNPCRPLHCSGYGHNFWEQLLKLDVAKKKGKVNQFDVLFPRNLNLLIRSYHSEKFLSFDESLFSRNIKREHIW